MLLIWGAIKLAVALILVVCLALLMILVKDLRCYLFWRRHYKAQGISYEYVPLLGMIYYFLVKVQAKFEDMTLLNKYKPGFITKNDMIAKFRQLADRKRAEPIVAINH